MRYIQYSHLLVIANQNASKIDIRFEYSTDCSIRVMTVLLILIQNLSQFAMILCKQLLSTHINFVHLAIELKLSAFNAVLIAFSLFSVGCCSQSQRGLKRGGRARYRAKPFPSDPSMI